MILCSLDLILQADLNALAANRLAYMLQVADQYSSGATAFMVRLPRGADAAWISWTHQAGASAVVLSRCETAEQVQSAVVASSSSRTASLSPSSSSSEGDSCQNSALVVQFVSVTVTTVWEAQWFLADQLANNNNLMLLLDHRIPKEAP